MEERERIVLSNDQWRDLVHEEYLYDELRDIEVPIKVVEREYEGSGRHTEHHCLVFQNLDNSKFYRVAYDTSVKDSMGWEECNYGKGEAIEVFQKEVTKFIYE